MATAFPGGSGFMSCQVVQAWLGQYVQFCRLLVPARTKKCRWSRDRDRHAIGAVTRPPPVLAAAGRPPPACWPTAACWPPAAAGQAAGLAPGPAARTRASLILVRASDAWAAVSGRSAGA